MLAGCQSSIAVATPALAPTAGEIRIDPQGIEQVWVPAGSFRMGTSEAEIPGLKAPNPPCFVLGELASEQPQHDVRFSNGYWIDKFEVTNAAFGVFVKSGGYRSKSLWTEAGWKWLSGQ